MFNPKCNIRGNPEMQLVEKRAHELWWMLPKTTEQWEEYASCTETLITYWLMEERKKGKK